MNADEFKPDFPSLPTSKWLYGGIMRRAYLLLILTSALPLWAAEKPAAPAWVERSNQNTRSVLQSEAEFAPEFHARLVVEGFDEKIVDLKPGVFERTRAVERKILAELESRLTKESDPLVKQDLEILIKAEKDNIKGSLINEKYELPYFNVARTVFLGQRSLLDEQIPAERQRKALVRLKRYAGQVAGYTPVTKLAEDLTCSYMKKLGLLFPAQIHVEKDLADQQFLTDGIGKLYVK